MTTSSSPDWLPEWMNPSREWLVAELERLDAVRRDVEARIPRERDPRERRIAEMSARFLANRRDSHARELAKRYPES